MRILIAACFLCCAVHAAQWSLHLAETFRLACSGPFYVEVANHPRRESRRPLREPEAWWQKKVEAATVEEESRGHRNKQS